MPARPNQRTPELQHDPAYRKHIIASLQEPFVVLDKIPRVCRANTASYLGFHVADEERRQPVESPTVRALPGGGLSGLKTRTLVCRP